MRVPRDNVSVPTSVEGSLQSDKTREEITQNGGLSPGLCSPATFCQVKKSAI